MAMRCLRKLLGITYRDHISNEEVRNRTRHAIGPHEDLLTTVKRRKLKWYGHSARREKSKRSEYRSTQCDVECRWRFSESVNGGAVCRWRILECFVP